MTTETYYVDPMHGEHTNDGLSPARPFKNHEKVDVHPGDTVLFKRGSVIRGPLQTHDGIAGTPVTFGAYGEGNKPAFLGSIPIGDPNLWVLERPSIWRYRGSFSSEVCNLIFNEGESCGILRWETEDLRLPGDWHYTRIGATSMGESRGGPEWSDGILHLCSPENPGHAWRDIECVLWGARRLVGGRRHIVLEHLVFRNSGVHGFQDSDVRDVTIRHCEFRFIGGAVWHREHRIRFGNAVEFWDGASDITVENCVFDNIYDSAVTHQGGETRNIPERLHFRNNLFVDCGLSAYECREPSREVYFEHNTCIHSGGGFSMQGEAPPRQSNPYPQPVGYHVMIWLIDPNTQPGKVYIRHNLFCESSGAAISAIIEPADAQQFIIDHNTYWQTRQAPLFQFERFREGMTGNAAVALMVATGELPLRPGGRAYATEAFSRWQAESGQDAHSQVAQPQFRDAARGDFRLCGERIVNHGVTHRMSNQEPPENQTASGMTVPAAIAGDPLLAEAYRAAAEQNVLRALNPKVFFGYFSVCADGQGHGHNTTYPGLDWGQSAEALLWLGRRAEVLASWEYVTGFQREDGLVPFAILPDGAGKTSMVSGRYPLVVDARGAVFEHWVPGNPLRTLANVTFLLLADAIWSQTGDRAWLQDQAPCLRKAAEWLMTQITEDGLMRGGGFYVERPTRLEFDGINQCYSAHALKQAAALLDHAGETTAAGQCRTAADVLTNAFRTRFWAGDHCVEYIHPEHGPVGRHGLTDVDWAAIATGRASDEQVAALWPQLRDNPDFIYSGIPGGIATRPETYEDWEMQHIDRHDLAAMGRVWYLECWARARLGDRTGLLRSLRHVAAVGKANNWSWMERYYSEKTGDLGKYHFQYYCEYPANFIRIVHRFLAATGEKQ